MKKWILLGRSGCGKTTLLQRLEGRDIVYEKTQGIELSGSAIDTPGEYMEHKKLFRALVVTAVDAELAVLVQDCRDTDTTFFPGMGGILNMPMVGVASKTDLAAAGNLRRTEQLLELAGAARVFGLSAYTGDGFAALRAYLEQVCGE